MWLWVLEEQLKQGAHQTRQYNCALFDQDLACDTALVFFPDMAKPKTRQQEKRKASIEHRED